MLVLIPFFLQAFFLLHVYGTVAFILSKSKLPINPFIPLLFGFPVLGVISLYFVIGGPINDFSYFVILFGAFIAIWRYKYYFQVQWSNFKSWVKSITSLNLIILLGIFFIILYQSALPSKINDMIMYYLQTLFWMEEYGAIKGLGNLHPAIGLSSAWHSLLVLLGEHGTLAKVLEIRFFALNGILLFSFILFLFSELKIEKNGLVFPFFALILLLGFVYLTAPSPDFPLLVFIPFLLYTILRVEGKLLSYNVEENIYHPILFALLGCFIFAVKPPAFVSVISLVFFGLNLLYQALKGRWLPFIHFALTVSLCIAPLLYKNYLQTGYPLYPAGVSIPENILSENPSSLTELTSNQEVLNRKPFWKLPADWNESFRKGVQTWGYSDRLDQKVFKVAQPRKFERFKTWISRPGYKGLMNKFLFANFLFGFLLILHSIVKREGRPIIYLVSSIFLLLCFVEWVFLSQYRLMLATGLSFFGWNILLLCRNFPKVHTTLNKFTMQSYFHEFIFTLIFAIYAIMAFIPFSVLKENSRNKSITQMDGFNTQYLLKPAITYSAGPFKNFQVDSITFHYYPNQTYASDCPIPAISLSHRKFLAGAYKYRHRAVGKNVESGFFLERLEMDSINRPENP
jgi:hypothetical protein